MNHFSAKIFSSQNTSFITLCTYCQFLVRNPWVREWEIIYSVLALLTSVSLSITILRYHHSSRSLSKLIQKPPCPLHVFREKLIEIPLISPSLHTKACLARLNPWIQKWGFVPCKCWCNFSICWQLLTILVHKFLRAARMEFGCISED